MVTREKAPEPPGITYAPPQPLTATRSWSSGKASTVGSTDSNMGHAVHVLGYDSRASSVVPGGSHEKLASKGTTHHRVLQGSLHFVAVGMTVVFAMVQGGLIVYALTVKMRA